MGRAEMIRRRRSCGAAVDFVPRTSGWRAFRREIAFATLTEHWFSTNMDFEVPRIENYARLVGDQTIDRILTKAKRLAGFHVTHINSTYYGGGVAELLSTLTLLLNGLGIRTGWRVLQGAPDFYGITKNMHNALQGMPFESRL